MPVEITNTQTSQTLDQQVDKIKQIESAQKQLDKLQVKLTKEKQFGRKADINKQLKIKQKQLDKLKAQ
jgi:RPA family protein